MRSPPLDLRLRCALSFFVPCFLACGDDVSTTKQNTNTATSSDAAIASADASTAHADAAAGDAGTLATPTQLTFADGPLSGLVVGGVQQFLGIPYAKPPLGPLRWQPPQPNDTWTAPRDATQFGKRCAQQASAVLMNAASTDEDCLYLNVWTPNPTAAPALPVMVWIHGGGNVNGSANEPVPYANSGLFYSGQHLAEKNVVVVTLNYRLGVFGFFSHAGLAAENGNVGNQGLLDQVAALQWVKKNIEKFGGDPDNVTIFGESAGSLDVCLHVASPKTRGLFHKAISESGGCTTIQPTQAQAQAAIDTFATQQGCSGSPADVLTCLRGKPAADLVNATTAAGTFAPALDGAFLPDQPRSIYDQGDIAKVPYMLGSNQDEGTLFTLGTTLADQASYVSALQMQFGTDAAQTIADQYPSSNFADGMPTPYSAAYARVVGDARLVCTTFDAAVRASSAGASVFMYNFDIPAPIQGLGATHGSELTSVFGTSPAFSPDEQAASDLMQRYWTNFARNGDPNDSSDAMWPAFSATSNVRMNFALPASSVVNDFRAKECAFWRAGYDKSFTTMP